MSKQKKVEQSNTQKTQTHYDKKMEKRAKEAKQQAKEERMLKIGGIVLALALVVCIVAAIAIPMYRKNQIVNGTYVTVGNASVSKQEYDYYYYDLLNSYKSMLASFGGGGVDFNGDLSTQMYSEEQSWQEFFDELTMEQLKRNKALNDKADEVNFAYDATEDYETYVKSVEDAANNAGVTVEDYRKQAYGSYITEQAAETYAKQSLRANAYYQEIASENKPSKEEIQATYEADKNSYDLVDYRSFALSADASEDASADEIKKAMEETKKQAEEMEKRLEASEDFNALCAEYAPEEQKEGYQDAEKDKSLHSDTGYTGVPTALKDWMFDENRKAGDRTVLADEENDRYYVAEFIERKYDEGTEQKISDSKSHDKAEEIVSQLVEKY